MDPFMTCAPNEDEKLIFHLIPLYPQNLRTVKVDCDELDRCFSADGSFMNPANQCGPCNCAMIGDIDIYGDGVPNSCDICPGSDDNVDMDGDGVPDGCDSCMIGDADGDDVCDDVDICMGSDDRIDTDSDGIPDGCDDCVIGDSDDDGVCDDVDICIGSDD